MKKICIKKIALIGCQGQVGFELKRSLACLGHVIAYDRSTLPLDDLSSMEKTLKELAPDVIVNAAAYTQVDKAETEQELATLCNTVAPIQLAKIAKDLDAYFITYSTDYVFNGHSETPYEEHISKAPLNTYGKTKAYGEDGVLEIGCKSLILRLSWIYATRGKNFFLTMLKLAKEKSELKIVNDQWGAPTPARLVAEATALILKDLLNNVRIVTSPEIYHLSCAGKTSWAEFAETIFTKYSQKNPSFSSPKVIPISYVDYGAKILRPTYSVLSNNKITQEFQISLPNWEEGLDLILEEYMR